MLPSRTFLGWWGHGACVTGHRTVWWNLRVLGYKGTLEDIRRFWAAISIPMVADPMHLAGRGLECVTEAFLLAISGYHSFTLPPGSSSCASEAPVELGGVAPNSEPKLQAQACFAVTADCTMQPRTWKGTLQFVLSAAPRLQ